MQHTRIRRPLPKCAQTLPAVYSTPLSLPQPAAVPRSWDAAYDWTRRTTERESYDLPVSELVLTLPSMIWDTRVRTSPARDGAWGRQPPWQSSSDTGAGRLRRRLPAHAPDDWYAGYGQRTTSTAATATAAAAYGQPDRQYDGSGASPAGSQAADGSGGYRRARGQLRRRPGVTSAAGLATAAQAATRRQPDGYGVRRVPGHSRTATGGSGGYPASR